MVAICSGAGLIRDARGRLTINTPPNPFNCDTLRGEPLLFDVAGRVRGAPRQEVVNTFYSEGTPGFIYIPPNGFLANLEHTFTVNITNPDPCRRLRGSGIWQCRIATVLQGGSGGGFDPGAIRVTGGGDSAKEYFREEGTAAGDPRTMYWDFIRTTTIDIPPGAAANSSIELAATRIAGSSFSTEVIEMRVALRVMAVSNTPT